MSPYTTESSFTGRESRLRRYSLRLDGFASIHAKLQQGEITTKPITFSGKELPLNVATSAAGSVQVELCSPDGTPIRGFTLADCDIIYGASLDRRVSWKQHTCMESLVGQPDVLRVAMRETDVYSFVSK